MCEATVTSARLPAFNAPAPSSRRGDQQDLPMSERTVEHSAKTLFPAADVDETKKEERNAQPPEEKEKEDSALPN